MNHRRYVARLLAGGLAASVTVLGGCATATTGNAAGNAPGQATTSTPIPVPDFVAAPLEPGWPDTVAPQFYGVQPGAAWSDEPGVIWVFTIGASSCPINSDAHAIRNEYGVTVRLSTREGGTVVCTDDLAPATSKVQMPPGISDGEQVIVTFVPDDTLNSQLGARRVALPPRNILPGRNWAGWPAATDTDRQRDISLLTEQPGGFARGLPSQIQDRLEYDHEYEDGPGAHRAGIAWSDLEGLLYVMTWGSSSCPIVADSQATLAADGSLTIGLTDLSQRYPGACTADNSPTTTIVGVPDGVDNHALTVHLGDLGTVELQARGPQWNPGVAHINGPVTWIG